MGCSCVWPSLRGCGVPRRERTASPAPPLRGRHNGPGARGAHAWPRATSASRRSRQREGEPQPDVLPPGGRRRCLRERPDILVEPKDIRRIVLLLHLHQAGVIVPKRLAHPLRLIGPEVVDVHAAHAMRV